MKEAHIHSISRIHPTAIVEEGVFIGAGTSVWDNVHVRKNAEIGEGCIIGEKTYIAYDVKIGNNVKISSFVYICTGVIIEDQVMISAGTKFTNDKYPRAFDLDGASLKTSNPTEETMETRVCRGATLGANCTIGPGIRLGEYCMVGMGSVVTHSFESYQLLYGNPAKLRGLVCICGKPLINMDIEEWVWNNRQSSLHHLLSCSRCCRRYFLSQNNCLSALD